MNIYDFEPIRVHVNQDVYYFYFKENFTEDDYEPVKEVNDNNKSVLISRYHWRLLTFWTNLVVKNGQANVSFGSNWHTPFAQCENYRPEVVALEPKGSNSKAGDKYALIKLVTLFLPYFMSQIYFKFKGSPIEYNNLITNDKVPDKFNFTFDNMVGLVVVGNSQDVPFGLILELKNKYRRKSIRT